MSARGKKGSSKRGKPEEASTESGLVVLQESTTSLNPTVVATSTSSSGSSSSSTVVRTVTMTSTSSSSNGAAVTKGGAAAVTKGGATAVTNGSTVIINGAATAAAAAAKGAKSPARELRIHEKEELQNCNDRFANYIERARNLEAENMALNVQMTNTKEIHSQEISSLKLVFEAQLEDTKKRLVNAEARNGQLEMEVKKWKTEATTAGAKWTKAESENGVLRQALSAAEANVANLTEKLTLALSGQQSAMDECFSLKVKFSDMEKQFNLARSQLEDGILARAGLENQLRAVAEELDFKKNVLQVNTSNISVTTLVESEASVNIELKLQESLQGLREHYDKKAAALKAELQAMYKAQLKGMNVASESVVFESDAPAELAQSELRISELTLQLNNLNGKIHQYEGKIASLEKEMANRDAKNGAALSLKDKQIGELQSQVGEYMRKYNDLTNLHLAMEVEVEAYGKLLFNEEGRLKIPAQAPAVKGKKNLKQELQTLNDRFALYIEENLKNLAAEKVQLTMELQSIEVKHQQQLANITSNYEVRLAEKQNLLDGLSKANASLEVEVKKWKDKANGLSAKLKTAQGELAVLEGKYRSLEKEFTSLSAKYELVLKEKQAALDGNAKFKLEVGELQMRITTITKDLEAANWVKTNLGAELGSYKQDSQMNKSMYDAELKELRLKTEIEISEMDDSALIESDARLERSLHELRRHFDERAAAMKLELQGKYEGKIAELQSALSLIAKQGQVSSDARTTSESKIRALTFQVEDLTQKLKMAESRYSTLQKAMQSKEATFRASLATKDAEIEKLKKELSEKMLELRELMNIKLALDLELAAYDKMLVAEEELFGIEATKQKTKSAKSTDSLAAQAAVAVEFLKTLNDRFATYAEKVQHMRAENKVLEVKVQKIEESAAREIASIKGLFEAELSDARALIDQTAKEKAQLQIEVGKWTSKADDLAAQLANCQAELAALKKSLKASEAKVADLTAKLAAATKGQKEAAELLASLKLKFAEIESQLILAKKQLEQETIVRVDLENRLQSLKEELVFKKSVFDAELNQSRSKLDLSVEIIAPELKESKVHEYLRDLRQQNDSQSSALRAELTAIYESKVVGMAESSPQKVQAANLEIASSLQINELNLQLADLTAKVEMYAARLAAMSEEAAATEANLRGVIADKEGKINQLQIDMSAQLNEYHELLDIKLALDMEIAAYRKMLEGEEERLNSSRSPTPTRGMKRKRASHIVTSTLSSGVSTTAASTNTTSSSTYVNVAKAIDAAAASAAGDEDYQVQTKNVKLSTKTTTPPKKPASALSSVTTRSHQMTSSAPSSSITYKSATSTSSSSSSSALAGASAIGGGGGKTSRTVVQRTVVRQGAAEAGAEAEAEADNKNCAIM